MTQHEDIEVVKKVADRISDQNPSAPCPECTGQNAHADSCSHPYPVIKGDIVTHAVPVDEGLEEAKRLASQDWPRREFSTPTTGYGEGGGNASVTFGNPTREVGAWPNMPSGPGSIVPVEDITFARSEPYDAVEPPHYKRGPRILLLDRLIRPLPAFTRSTLELGAKLWTDIDCIEVLRHIQDPRLATAFKYLWRVAFGGKKEPWDSRSQQEVDIRDINSAIWYLQDWIKHPPEYHESKPNVV